MIRIKRGDTYYGLKATLKRNGTPVNLTGCTVKFTMANGSVKVSKTAQILDAANGLVRIVLDGYTEQVGTYRGEFEVTYQDGRRETFPSDDYLTIQIVPDLD